MIERRVFNYDTDSGQVTDDNHSHVGSFLGVVAPLAGDLIESKPLVDDIVKLKEAGFAAEEIIEMKKKGLI